MPACSLLGACLKFMWFPPFVSLHRLLCVCICWPLHMKRASRFWPTRAQPELDHDSNASALFCFYGFHCSVLGGDRRAQYACRCEKLLLLLASASRRVTWSGLA